jgi:hypothetical protein
MCYENSEELHEDGLDTRRNVSRLQLKSDYFKKYCALTNGKEKVMF